MTRIEVRQKSGLLEHRARSLGEIGQGRRMSEASKLVGRPVASLFPGQDLPEPKSNVATPVRTSIVGPRGEPLRASAVALAEGGFVVVLHCLGEV